MLLATKGMFSLSSAPCVSARGHAALFGVSAACSGFFHPVADSACQTPFEPFVGVATSSSESIVLRHVRFSAESVLNTRSRRHSLLL